MDNLSGYRIGYEQLSPHEKKAYDLFEKSFSSFAKSVDSSSISKNVDVMKVLQVALGDNPRVIYFNKTQIKVSGSLFGGKQIQFCGTYSSNQIRKMNQEIDRMVSSIMEEISLLNPLSDYDKLMCIYEYLQDYITYDSKELEYTCRHGSSLNPASHNAYGALIEKTAVCDGISAAFSLLAQQMGYDCTIVSGSAAFMTKGFSSHAWNLIRVGDKFYHIDATWDINHYQQTKEYSYEYFCVNDDSINVDHNWDIKSTPPCNNEDISFYIKSGCFANTLSQIDEIFTRYAKSKTQVVRLKVSDRIAIPEPNDTFLAQKLIDISSQFRGGVSIQFVWNKDTRCFYAKFS